MKRRNVLGIAAGLSIGAVAAPGRAEAATGEQLSNYASHVSDARSVTVTSATGQRLRITAYGNQIVRVRAVRSGETFFSDTRYEMVVPANHSGMGGNLSVTNSSTALTIETGAADGVRIVVQKNPLRLEFYQRDTGALLVKEDATRSITWGGTNNSVITEAFVPPPTDEQFVKAGHGLYGRSPRVVRTGDVVSHNYGATSTDQSPAIIPLYLSTKGYGVFFNTTFDTTFSFAGSTARDYYFSADDHATAGVRPQMDYFFINGPQFAKLLDRYTQLTGRPRLPQLAIFGLHMSDKTFPEVSDQNWWRTKITQHRNAGFPFDHQVNDNRWRAGSGSWSGSWFEFSPTRWPDPADYQTWAAANGVTVTLDYNRNNSNLMAGWVGGPPPGYSFKAADLTGVSDNGSVPDWSNPATRAWVWNVFWTKALNPALQYPGDGLWIDETDQMGPIPFNADTAIGRKWSELRNAYFFYLHKGVGAEGWDPQSAGHIGTAKRPWSWSRGGSAGQQRYGHYWTGDINSTYDEMQQQIRGMLVSGLGGFPYHNVDGGGFHGQTSGAISEPFYRNWPAAWSSLSPIWRPHGQANVATQGLTVSRWPLDRSAAIQADFRKYGELRYTLLPYIYSIAHEAAATGMPMARAMVIDYQSRANAYTHDLQYMWGPSLLVAPVTSDGGATQNVWLPAGATWYNFWADIKHVGTDSADLPYVTRTGEIVLFVKAGAILPKYPYVQSTAFVSKRQLELEVYAGANGSFNLIEDDGVTESYRVTGAKSTTALTYADGSTRTTIAHPQGTYAGAPTARRYVVRIHGLAAPVGMRVNGGTTLPAFNSEAAAVTSSGGGTYWDAGRKVLSVVTSSIAVVTGGGVAATVEPSGSAYPAATGGIAYQAERAVISGGVIDTRHADYTGTGFVDFADTAATGAYIEWSVAVATAGTKTLTFRFANGATANRPLAITVNGATVNSALAFNPTGSWGTWSTTSFTASLPAGSAVKVRATTIGSNGANIDSLTIT